MVSPLGLMTGADVGIVEKEQGRFTFPESDPLTGLIIDNVPDAERQKEKELNASPVHIIYISVLTPHLFFFSPKYIHLLIFYLFYRQPMQVDSINCLTHLH